MLETQNSWQLQPDTVLEQVLTRVRCTTCEYTDQADTTRADDLTERLMLSIAIRHAEQLGHVIRIYQITEVRS